MNRLREAPSPSAVPAPFVFRVDVQSPVILGRAASLYLPHGAVPTPIYMPVATQATLKGITTDQIEELNPPIILNNTYFVSERPGAGVLRAVETSGGEGTHDLMGWHRNILTDSGGFQMVSLLNLSTVTEEGVEFRSPHDSSVRLLRPEDSVAEQAAIGSDCVMVLDDVIASTLDPVADRARIVEATQRTVRWLDRCLAQAQLNPLRGRQSVYAILQGHLDPELRKWCIEQFAERKDGFDGIAIGGLSGGESKDDFWHTIFDSVKLLNELMPGRPRYLMGVGLPLDVITCAALGVDQMDCVYACRTGRFGTALTEMGTLRLRNAEFTADTQPLQPGCTCETCRCQTRASLRALFVAGVPNAGILVSIHNVHFLLSILKGFRAAIIAGPDTTRRYLHQFYANQCGGIEKTPQWCRDALRAMNLDLWDGQDLVTKDQEESK